MRYSAKPIIDFISDPDNGLKVDGGVPVCPKGDGCLDDGGNCSYPAGCRQKILFFREKNENHGYGYYSLVFTFPLHKKVGGDGYVDENNGSLMLLLSRNIISRDVLKIV